MIDERLCRMEVALRQPHVVDCRNPPNYTAYVVMGDTDHAGTVKQVKVAFGQSYPFLECNWETDFEDNHVLKLMRIPHHYIKRGWFFLERAYDEEGNAHGKAQWHEFQKACSRGRVYLDKQNKDTGIVPGFPDELLPKAVHNAVKRRDKSIDAWKAEIPEAKVAKGAK